jgi:hypothetical protein
MPATADDGGSSGSDAGDTFRADSDGELHLNFENSSDDVTDGHDANRHHQREQLYESEMASRVFHLKTNVPGVGIRVGHSLGVRLVSSDWLRYMQAWTYPGCHRLNRVLTAR